MITRARKIVTKFHNYSYEIVMSPVIVNSYKNAHNSYQIFQFYFVKDFELNLFLILILFSFKLVLQNNLIRVPL